ncbi:hypothetical protein [Limnoglobus roseus]|uniref:DUF1877 family protein n=1 Tax=Limnoglobus roseus TaxID=2598579 RepID=A0A5C1AJ90_9BACT|nr:hypothetical protein [Limnoglobus roseus]QEL19251.1 hypothetical protein PX52LOC_06313 [Limnoglobus roseus]
MSVLTDFVISNAADAERVCRSNPTDRRFKWFQAKWLDNHQVAVLHPAAAGRSFDPTVPLPDALLSCLAIGGEDGPVVYRVPPDLVERLASLDAAELTAVADRWAADPCGISREGAEYAVSGLAALCGRAHGQGKAVLLLMTV